MKHWQIFSIAGAFAILSGFAGYQLQQHLSVETPTQQENTVVKPVSAKDVIGSKVDDFRLEDLHGEQRSLSEWQGKIIIINFWATWCAPCREEIPAFTELQQQYANDDIQFVGIALQSAEEIRDFINEFNVNYPSLVGDSEVIKLGTKLGNHIGALPYTVIVDRSGIIRFTRRGPLSKSEAETQIRALI